MLSLRQRISWTFAIVVLVFGIAVLLATQEMMSRHNTSEHIRWGQTLVRSLSESLAEHVINREQIQAAQVLKRVKELSANLDYIYVVGFEGEIFSHTFDKGVPQTLLQGYDARIPSQYYILNNSNILEIWAPLIDGMQGRIHIGINTDADVLFLRNTIFTVSLLTIILIILAVMVGSVISKRFAAPLEKMASGINELDFEQEDARLQLETDIPEIKVVVSNFNNMLEERNRALVEILYSRESLKKAQQIAHIGNWDWDITNGTLNWSDEVYRIFGFQPGEFAATYEAFIERIHKDDQQRVIDAVNTSLENPAVEYRVEHRVVQSGGELRWVEETGEIKYKKDKAVKMVGVVHDITERKKAELILRAYHDELEQQVKVRTTELSEANQQLQQLDNLKSMFIASMSHELRTPLNSIIGFTGVILNGMAGELNELQQGQLQRVMSSAKHLLSLISDIIDISKIEAGRVDISIEEINLSELLSTAIANIQKQFDDKGIELVTHIEAGILLYSDRTRLSQVLINVLSNAVKYTEAGTVTIRCKKRANEIQVSVEDTGVGISEQDLEKLFEPFERIDNKLSVAAGGTGLGLYLTQKLLAEVLQGSISVSSKPGKGSCFTITLPCELNEFETPIIEGAAL